MVTTRSATSSLPKKSPESEAETQISKARPTKSATKKTTSKKRAQSIPVSAPPASSTATSESTQRNNGTTLLDLPPEIRNEIYALSFDNKRRRIMIGQSQTYIPEPALVAVSRQTRAEALAMWYSEQIFEIQGSSPAMKFLRSLSNEKLSLLRTIHIQVQVISSIDYARQRIRQLMREFGPKGLPTQALQFQVIQGGSLVWAGVDDLDDMVEDEAQRPSANRKGNPALSVGGSRGW